MQAALHHAAGAGGCSGCASCRRSRAGTDADADDGRAALADGVPEGESCTTLGLSKKLGGAACVY